MFDSHIPGMRERKIVTFALLYLLYSGVHACRAVWSYISGMIVSEHRIEGFNTQFLGYVNFSFLVSLGLTYMIFGQYGDRIDTKKFVLFGSLAIGLMFLLMALLIEFTDMNRWFYLLMLALVGMVSSTPWPGCLAILNQWFPKQGKLILLGFFASCVNFGNILGFTFAGFTIELLDWPILTPVYLAATFLLVITLACQFFIKSVPDVIEEVTVTDKSIDSTKDTIETPQIEKPEELEILSFWRAWTLPGVTIYAFAFGCIKAVFSVLGLWLPNYLDSLHVSYVAFINVMVDLGAGIGGVAVCYLGFHYDKRATFIVPSLWVGTILMVAINFLKGFTDPVAGYMILAFFTGLCIGGCYNNIASAVSVELSNTSAMKKFKHGTSTISSLLLGYATAYLALNQIVIPYVRNELFLFCGLQSMIAGLLLIPIIISEWKPRDKVNVQEVEMH